MRLPLRAVETRSAPSDAHFSMRLWWSWRESNPRPTRFIARVHGHRGDRHDHVHCGPTKALANSPSSQEAGHYPGNVLRLSALVTYLPSSSWISEVWLIPLCVSLIPHAAPDLMPLSRRALPHRVAALAVSSPLRSVSGSIALGSCATSAFALVRGGSPES